MPEIFDNLDVFTEWFDTIEEITDEHDHTASIINALHQILKPFLLRRVKSDVMKGLPPKREYLIYAPMTKKQKEYYDAILTNTFDAVLLKDLSISTGYNFTQDVKFQKLQNEEKQVKELKDLQLTALERRKARGSIPSTNYTELDEDDLESVQTRSSCKTPNSVVPFHIRE
jgi:ATP-dependent DNA helicase